MVKFVFADEKGVKQRPGLLVSSARYYRSRREAILAAITSPVGRALVGDYRLERWKEAGLPLPSTVTGIIRTITQDMIIRKIGSLPPADGSTRAPGFVLDEGTRTAIDRLITRVTAREGPGWIVG